MSVDQFTERYGIGRSKTYEQIAAGRLRALKVGKRTIIREDDAEDWLSRLPVMGGSRNEEAE
jgi:excisionase family DNA binding protein